MKSSMSSTPRHVANIDIPLRAVRLVAYLLGNESKSRVEASKNTELFDV